MSQPEPVRALYIRMHPADNVAIVGNDGGLAAGAVFPDGLCLRERVPQGHKPYGLAEVPVIKVATRSDLARRWHDLMDVNAGRIADGAASIEDVGWELFHLMLEVASGRKKTWAEHWQLHNALVLFNPAPIT